MASKHNFVTTASRPHDFIYDPVFTVPTAKDVQRAAFAAAQKVAEVHLRPSFTCMFSELNHFPSAYVVRSSQGRLPIVPAPQPMGSSTAYPPSTSRDVTGIDRHKYFTSALEGSEETSETAIPALIRCAPVPWQPEIKEVTNVGPQLRTSLAEPTSLPRKHSLPKLKDATTQTVPQKSPGAHERERHRGVSAERALIITRARDLETAATWRLQQAGELRGEHAADASESRAARRAKIHQIWVNVRGEELSRMMKKHNRELRKLTREFGTVCSRTAAGEHLDPGSRMYAPPLRLGMQKSNCERLGLPSVSMASGTM